jgi:hypothetical protein
VHQSLYVLRTLAIPLMALSWSLALRARSSLCKHKHAPSECVVFDLALKMHLCDLVLSRTGRGSKCALLLPSVGAPHCQSQLFDDCFQCK